MSKPAPKTNIWLYILLGLVVLIAIIFYVLRMTGAFDGDISGHGWAALLAGTIVSILLGGGLTAVLIWGRRNGYDEGAHEINWAKPDQDDDG